MTKTRKYIKFTHQITSLSNQPTLRIGLRRAVLCMLILTLMPFWPAPQPVQARGFFGFVSKVVPFIGVGVGLHHRNRVYRSSEQFIRERNQYYDGLQAMAYQQFKQKEMTTVGRTRLAAYLKVSAMIEQERAGQLAMAEGRKRQARAQFQKKFNEALIYAAAGSRLAQEVLGSMINGVDSMQQVLDRALNKLVTGDSDFLQDLQSLKEKASLFQNVSSIVGGKLGAKLGAACGRIVNGIESAQIGVTDIGSLVKAELSVLRDVLFVMKEVGRKPTAGEVIDHVKARFLPESSDNKSIPTEAIATIISQLKAGDGSLKDEARRALNAGFAARCATYSKAFQMQLESLKKTSQQESTTDPAAPTCKAIKTEKQDQKTEDATTLDELLEFDEDEEEKKLPKVTASGTLSEGMSGALNTNDPMGTTFQLSTDFSAGTINGTLKGSRTSTPGGWMNCYDPADPSVEFDRIDVNTTESYEASFSGAIDKETGEFSIAITPIGGTTATKVSLFTHERCLSLNSKKYSGEGGWNGKGTISGGVSKDGGIEFNTSWTYSWFKGEVQVGGKWSGNGIVSSP